MSEITKLYKNVGIKICKRKQGFTLKDCTDRDCKECGYYDIPPFTAEKQLELLKLLIRHSKTELYCRYANNKYKLIMYTEDCCTSDMDSFENVLASVVCDVWGLLSEEEKEALRGILRA